MYGRVEVFGTVVYESGDGRFSEIYNDGRLFSPKVVVKRSGNSQRSSVTPVKNDRSMTLRGAWIPVKIQFWSLVPLAARRPTQR